MSEAPITARLERLLARLEAEEVEGSPRLRGELSELLAAAHAADRRQRQAEDRLRRAERAVRESEARLERAATLAHLGSYEHKVADDPEQPDFEDIWSPEMYRILGVDPSLPRPPAEELIARIVHPDDRERLRRAIEQMWQEVKRVDVEYRVLRPDGSTRHVQSVSEPVVNSQGKLVRVLGALLDVTERKRLEQDLFQDRKMEALGRLSSGIAHDFNNLLMGIMGCCRLAERKLEAGAPARLYLEEMRAGAERGTALTRQLLSFGRKRPVQSRTIPLNAVIGSTEELLRQLLGEHIVCELRLASGAPQVVADPGQIEQILMNLVVNARDAMPQGGLLRIETELVSLTRGDLVARPGRPPGVYARLRVVDTGHGMDNETLDNVFEPFFTTKQGDQGTGLGLATVYGIVSQLDGFIHIDSQVGEGTTFALYFPSRDASEPTEHSARKRVVEPSGGGTVVVVEDERLVRMTVCDYLRNSGYTVLEAASPEEALALVEGHVGRIDLLLTDMVMPGMNGRALAGLLLSQRPDLRVIYMSAYPGEWLVEQGLLEPGQVTLGKPFTSEVLLDMVRAALAGSD